jgi:hypothetical protein
MKEIHSTRPRVSMGVIGGRLPVARLRAHGEIYIYDPKIQG